VQTPTVMSPHPYAIRPPSVQLPIIPPLVPVKEEEKTKKRKREEPEVTFVQLPREDLLKMSSTELEDYVDRLKKVRPLSTAEHREVKRQRRLIKNREYAHTSRQKKKELVQTMKEGITEVQADNETLRVQVQELSEIVSTLKARNVELEEENKQLKAALGTTDYSPRSPVPTGVSPQSPSSGSVEESSSEAFVFDDQSPSGSLLESPTSMEFESTGFLNEPLFKTEEDSSLSNWFLNFTAPSVTTATTTTGFLVMAIFFSFALVLNPMSFGLGQKSSLPVELAPIDQPFVEVSPTFHSTGRHLCVESQDLLPLLQKESENASHQTCDLLRGSVISIYDVLSDEKAYTLPVNASASFVDTYFNFGELHNSPSTGGDFQTFPPRIHGDA